MSDHDDTKVPAKKTPAEEGDVEGHGMVAGVGGGPDDHLHTRIVSRRIDQDEDDVEGHFGNLKSPSSRGE